MSTCQHVDMKTFLQYDKLTLARKTGMIHGVGGVLFKNVT